MPERTCSIPAGNTKLQDGASTSGVEEYKEFWYTMAGLAGIGQNFDGNGIMTRFLVGAGGDTFRSAPSGDRRRDRSKGLQLIAHTPLAAAGHPPGLPGDRAAIQAAGALLHAELPELQRPAL